MPETVDKSSLSTLFPKYSPQLCLFDFFRTGAFLHAPRCVLPSLSFPAPPASGFSLSLFCFFFTTSPFLCLHLSSFLLRLAYFSAVLCHAFFGCCREGFLISARVFSFLFSRAVPPPCFPFLPFRFSFTSFCFRLILLLPLLLPLTAFCFLSHFQAATLALSFRPAILFIYLNYHNHMNIYSLARRFLP